MLAWEELAALAGVVGLIWGVFHFAVLWERAQPGELAPPFRFIRRP